MDKQTFVNFAIGVFLTSILLHSFVLYEVVSWFNTNKSPELLSLFEALGIVTFFEFIMFASMETTERDGSYKKKSIVMILRSIGVIAIISVLGAGAFYLTR